MQVRFPPGPPRRTYYGAIITYMFIAYVLRSLKNSQLLCRIYDNLQQRIETHNKGNVAFTKTKRPWKLILAEAYISQEDALRREKYFKTTQGKTL